MNRMLRVFGKMIATIFGTATVATAQTAIASGESPFRFHFEQSNGLTAWRSRATSDKVMREAPAPQAP
jgi:hypothetical protein